MFIESIRARIDDYNRLKRIGLTTQCPADVESAYRAIVIAITTLVIVYLILFILSFYYAFKCSFINKWPIIVPIFLILLSLIPMYGGFITIAIVIYGMLICGSICDAPKEIFGTK